MLESCWGATGAKNEWIRLDLHKQQDHIGLREEISYSKAVEAILVDKRAFLMEI